MSNTWCIYCHTTPNGKRYIGQTMQEPEDRWKSGTGYRKSPYFKSAIKKYGWDNIEHTILCWCNTKELADYLEQWFIKEYDTNNTAHGYNLTEGGGGGLGRKLSQESIEKIREGNRKNVVPEERRKRISESLKRKYKNGEIVRKPISEEEHERRRKAKLGPNNHNYGKHFSEEHRKKLSDANRGRKRTAEQRKRMSEAALNSTTRKRIPVNQYTIGGEFIRSYTSMKEAERDLGICSAAIRCCCEGRSYQSGGYIWCYQDKPETFPVQQESLF